MATHHNDDAGNPQINAAIRKLFEEKAQQMTERKLNTITAGSPDERCLYAELVDGVMVRQMPEDELALRISIGEPHNLDGLEEYERAYCVFRGQPSKVIELLERALAALKEVHENTRVP